MQNEKLWTKNFILATLSGLFSALVFYITMTTLAVYATLVYDAGASLAGLASSIFILGSLFGRIYCGRTLERAGRRKMLLLFNFFFALLGLLYFLPVSIGVFLAIRVLHGFTFGAVHCALSTIVVSFIPKTRLGEGIGFYSLNFVFATALGPLVGMLISRNLSYTALFLVCVLSAGLGLVLACLLRIEPRILPAGADAPGLASTKNKLSVFFAEAFEKPALPLSFVIILASLCYTGVTTFLESYTEALGLTGAAPVFFVVYAIFILVARPFAGKLLDRKGDNAVMIPTIIFFCVSLVVLALSHSFALLIVTAFFMALGYGNLLNMGQAVAVKSSSPERIATATATYFVFSDAGMGFGPLLIGLVVTARGYTGAYLVEALICAAALILYLLLHGIPYARSRSRAKKGM